MHINIPTKTQKKAINLIKTIFVGTSPKWYQLITSKIIKVIKADINKAIKIIILFFIFHHHYNSFNTSIISSYSVYFIFKTF